MTIAILATGDELIHGDTLNITTQLMAKALSSEGLPLGLQITASDKLKDLCDSFVFLMKEHDSIILTGGLGPTSDDRTRFIFEIIFNLKLTLFPEALEHVKQRLSQRPVLNEGDKQQALFPAGSRIFMNPYGTAMGCMFEHGQKRFYLLPGPPVECMPMFENFVLPSLAGSAHSLKRILKWRVFGVPESLIANQIDTAVKQFNCQTGYRYEPPYVECKVRCYPEDSKKIQQLIDALVAPHIIALPNERASEALRKRIEAYQIHISIIDNATGGVLQTLLQTPKTYPFLHFRGEHKAGSLWFKFNGCEAYWQDKGEQTCELSFECGQNERVFATEQKTIPYRTPSLMIAYCAEWLSFRMSQILDSLHQGVA